MTVETELLSLCPFARDNIGANVTEVSGTHEYGMRAVRHVNKKERVRTEDE